MELKLALVVLRSRGAAPRFSRWRRSVLTRFPESARPLWELVAAFSGAMSTVAVCGDIDEALDIARGLTRDQARQVASLWFGGGPVRAVPSWLRDAADGDRDVVLQAFSSAYAAILRPHWPAICASHHTEVARHGRRQARLRADSGLDLDQRSGDDIIEDFLDDVPAEGHPLVTGEAHHRFAVSLRGTAIYRYRVPLSSLSGMR